MSSWDTSGGKSESLFFKSEDDMFIIKKFPEGKETSMFQKFAMDYFNHMWRLCYENKPSLLGKIFGMFEVKEKGNVGYYLIMEYLYAGMPKEVTVYDLKGSETNRWIRNQNNVLLDTNFRIDRNAEPIPVIKDNFRFIDRAF